MEDNEDKELPDFEDIKLDEDEIQQGEEELPKDFRPIIPEPELRRPSVYNFSKNFPENDSPVSTHTVSFAQQEARRKIRNNILYVLALIVTFAFGFIITDASILISREPMPPTTAPLAQTSASTTVPSGALLTSATTLADPEEFWKTEAPPEDEKPAATERPAATKAPEPAATKPPATKAPETTTQEPTTQETTTQTPETEPPTTAFTLPNIFGF